MINEWDPTVSFKVTATLVGIERLTPAALAEQVAPYLQAIFDMETVLADLQNKPFEQPVLQGLSQNLPISISIEGAGDALTAITETVNPWKREYARAWAEINEIELRGMPLAAEADEVEQDQGDVALERQRLEKLALEREKLELDRQRVALAFEVVDKFSQHLPEQERSIYAMRLLPSLETLTMSGLELTMPQKPSTLPK